MSIETYSYAFFQSGGKAFWQSPGLARLAQLHAPHDVELYVPFNIEKVIGSVSESKTNFFRQNLDNSQLMPPVTTYEVGLIDGEVFFPFKVAATSRWSSLLQGYQIFYEKTAFLGPLDFDSTKGTGSLGTYDIAFADVDLQLVKDTATWMEDGRYFSIYAYFTVQAHRSDGGYFYYHYYWPDCTPWSSSDIPLADSPNYNAVPSPDYILNSIVFEADWGDKNKKTLKGECHISLTDTILTKKILCRIDANSGQSPVTAAYYTRQMYVCCEKTVFASKDSWLTNMYIKYYPYEEGLLGAYVTNFDTFTQQFSNPYYGVKDSTLSVDFTLSEPSKLTVYRGTVSVYLDAAKVDETFYGYSHPSVPFQYSKNMTISKTVKKLQLVVKGCAASAFQKLKYGFYVDPGPVQDEEYPTLCWSSYNMPYVLQTRSGDLVFWPQSVPYHPAWYGSLNISIKFTDSFKSFWTNNWELLFDEDYIPTTAQHIYFCDTRAYLNKSKHPPRFDAAFGFYGDVWDKRYVYNVVFHDQTTHNPIGTIDSPINQKKIESEKSVSTIGCMSLLTYENTIDIEVSQLHVKLTAP